ncbi:MAG: hypothetical protein AAF899_18005 [Pseudomonadota bacterium]
MTERPTGDDDQADAFFIGFLPVPGPLRGFLAMVGICGLLAAGALGYVVAATQDDPGDGRFRFELGRQALTGVLVEGAYPVLRLTEDSDHLAAGYSLMLSGIGKNGVLDATAALIGQHVRVEGVLLTRGALAMMQVRRDGDGPVIRQTGHATPTLPAPRPLGRWRLTGELCDGKCYAGAMRPGRGIAHKACANLCVIGGVPMVFVANAAVDGETHMLVTGPDGGAVPSELLDATAEIVTIEGEIERIGTLLVLRADAQTLGRP